MKLYREQLSRFELFLSESEIALLSLSFKEAREYKLFLRRWRTKEGASLSSSTIQGFLVRAKRFYDFLAEKNLIIQNPFNGVRPEKKETRLPRRPISEAQMDELLSFLKTWWNEEDTHQLQAGRYLAHVQSELMYSSGLRAFEVAGLKEEDIDLDRGIITLREGKGGNDRLVFLSSFVVEVLTIYLNELRPLILRGHTQNSSLLFGVAEGQFKNRLNAYLKEACQKVGLPKQTSHSFRHAFGSHLLRSGCDIRKIQGLLGHKSLNTTQVYTKLEKQDLKKILNNFHPLGKKELEHAC